MSKKITITSGHPEFVEFSIWMDQKKEQATQAGNTAEVAKIEAALAAKASANAGIAPASSIDVANDGDNVVFTVVRDELTVSVPEFDEYWNQWRDQFNVQLLIEEI